MKKIKTYIELKMLATAGLFFVLSCGETVVQNRRAESSKLSQSDDFIVKEDSHENHEVPPGSANDGTFLTCENKPLGTFSDFEKSLTAIQGHEAIFDQKSLCDDFNSGDVKVKIYYLVPDACAECLKDISNLGYEISRSSFNKKIDLTLVLSVSNEEFEKQLIDTFSTAKLKIDFNNKLSEYFKSNSQSTPKFMAFFQSSLGLISDGESQYLEVLAEIETFLKNEGTQVDPLVENVDQIINGWDGVLHQGNGKFNIISIK